MNDLVNVMRGVGNSKVKNFDLRTVGGFAIKRFDRKCEPESLAVVKIRHRFLHNGK